MFSSAFLFLFFSPFSTFLNSYNFMIMLSCSFSISSFLFIPTSSTFSTGSLDDNNSTLAAPKDPFTVNEQYCSSLFAEYSFENDPLQVKGQPTSHDGLPNASFIRYVVLSILIAQAMTGEEKLDSFTTDEAVRPKKDTPRTVRVKFVAERKGHNFLMDAIIIFNY